MARNPVNMYDIDVKIAEVYDTVETQTDDVELIRRLTGGRKRLRILEPFCGTGRLLIPLALDGHELTGMDQSKAMLDRAGIKIARLPEEIRQRISLTEADVTETDWPENFDIVIMGGNCLYELATPEEQAGCIASAASALRSGGYLYLDNNHMEGDLDESWRTEGVIEGSFPTGTCSDGTRIEGSSETVWFDAPKRIVRFHRRVKVEFPDGDILEGDWFQQKHPPSTDEMKQWLEKNGFAIEHIFGGRDGRTYTAQSERAIFWASMIK